MSLSGGSFLKAVTSILVDRAYHAVALLFAGLLLEQAHQSQQLDKP
jgi:hypothetical protein